MNGSSEGFLIKYRIKGKGLDTSGPGGSPGTGTPVDVYGAPSGPKKGGPKAKNAAFSPARSPAQRKTPPGKTPPKSKGKPNIKEIMANIVAQSENTGPPTLKQSKKGTGSHIYVDYPNKHF